LSKQAKELAMVLCNQCGSELADGLGFCTECGAPVGGVAPVAPQTALKIPTDSPDPRPEIEKRKLSLSAYAGVSILVVVLGGGAVLFFQKQRENHDAINRQAVIPAGAPNPAPSPSRKSNDIGRYSVRTCGAIQDSQTGLEWFVGEDRNLTWYEAQNWVVGLASCGGGWRMPTIEEVGALYDPSKRAGTGYYKEGRYFPAHIDPVFNAIGSGSWVWSGEKVGIGDARSFNLNQGKGVVYSATNTLYSTRAFAVRSFRK
jgi:uncharacterized protein DUF1566